MIRSTCTVTKLIPEKNFIEMATVCSVGGKVVIDGEATILVPRRIRRTSLGTFVLHPERPPRPPPKERGLQLKIAKTQKIRRRP